MSFFDTLKKVTAGITSGGSSLLLSKENQAKLGGGILTGAAAMIGAGAASGLAKGAQPGGTGMFSGAWEGIKSEGLKALSLGTAGSQKLGDLSQWAVDKLGIAGSTPAQAASMASGGYSPAGYTRTAPGGSQQLMGGQMMPATYTPGTAQAYPAMAGGGPAMATMGRWAGTMVGGALGLKALKGLMTSAWGYVSRKKVVAIVKAVGIEAAAVALGVGVVEVAQMVAADASSKTGRRRRGITASDLRRTRLTIGKINRMHAQLACLAKTSPKTRTRSC